MDVEVEEQEQKAKSHKSLINRLSGELLFTLEKVERHAQGLKGQSWLPKSRRHTLDQMLEETQRMNGLLKELMNTIKPGE